MRTTARVAPSQIEAPGLRIGILLTALFLGTFTTTAQVAAQSQTLIFSATGDIPYSASEIPILQQQIRDHNLYSPSEFLVHVGDIKSGTSSCTESVYRDMAGYLAELRVPTYVIPGDNEWNDCASPSQAWSYWEQSFTDFESQFCGTPITEHQSVRHENWAFVTKGVLCIGINLVGPSATINLSEWNTRLQQDADWVTQQLHDKAGSVRCAVLFSHDGPEDSRQALFYNQFRTAAATFGKPLLLVHGDDHSWKLDRPFSQQNVLRMTVNNGASEDPVQVTVTLDAQNPFVLQRDPWGHNPQPFNAPPCGAPAPTVAISDAQVVEGDAGTVLALFTVSLVNGTGTAVPVSWYTAPGTASANLDYDTATGTVQLSGSTDQRTIAVAVRGDAEFEPDETFQLNLAVGGGVVLADAQGLGTIENDDAGSGPLRFTPVQDAHVASTSVASNYGSLTTLRAKSDSAIYDAYLKFVVAGVEGSVQSAFLELYCTDESDHAGLVHLVANDYKGTTTPWVESGLRYDNAPVIAGTPLNTPVPAAPGTWIRFDVSAAVTGDGTYSFGIHNPSGNSVYFSSKEGANHPVLVVTTASEPPPPADPVAPVVGNFTPSSGAVGTEVTITGSDFTAVQTVAFGSANAVFIVDSATRLRATVPPSATTGRIVVANAAGSASSATDFEVTAPTAATLRIEPAHDANVTSSSGTSSYGAATTLRAKSDSSVYNTYLKFVVEGVAGPIQSATLELYCTDESDHAGLVHLVANDYLNTTTPWVEGGLTYKKAPSIAGAPLNPPVAAVKNTWVRFDVTAAITGNGTYSFALHNPSGNSVYYSSKEGAQRPVLVLQVGAPVANAAPESRARGKSPETSAELGGRTARFEFSRRVPNPTAAPLALDFAMPQAGAVTLTVYDVAGRLMRRMDVGMRQAGIHHVAWDATDARGRRAPSGVYFVCLQTGTARIQQRVTLVR